MSEAKSQHKRYAESGKVEGVGEFKAKRFKEGGFVKHGDAVHTAHGAPMGFGKLPKNKKGHGGC